MPPPNCEILQFSFLLPPGLIKQRGQAHLPDCEFPKLSSEARASHQDHPAVSQLYYTHTAVRQARPLAQNSVTRIIRSCPKRDTKKTPRKINAHRMKVKPALKNPKTNRGPTICNLTMKRWVRLQTTSAGDQIGSKSEVAAGKTVFARGGRRRYLSRSRQILRPYIAAYSDFVFK